MLAVVEDQKRVPRTQGTDQRFLDRLFGGLTNLKDGCHGRRDQRTVADRCEFDEPHAVRITIEEIRADLQGKPSLTDAARTDEGEKAGLVERLDHRKHLELPAYEARQLQR